MNAIVKVTGTIVLAAVACTVIGGSAALAGPAGPQVEMEMEACLTPDCVVLDPGLIPDGPGAELEPIPFDPCPNGPCVEIDPCLIHPCGPEVQFDPDDVPEYVPGQPDDPGKPDDDPTPTPTETEEPTPTETDVPPTATPTDDPGDDPGDEPTDEPGDLPNAGTGDGAASQDSQGVIALAGLGLMGVGIAGALALTYRRKQTR